MAQYTDKILPEYLNLDTAYEKLMPNETPFAKGLTTQINNNPSQLTGTNNPTNEGQNEVVLTPVRSNKPIPNTTVPEGYNLATSFESIVTQECYYFNYNSNGHHGIYVVDGNTGITNTIIIDPLLNFSNDPRYRIAEHRVKLRVVYDSNNNVKEKYLVFTDGLNWQRLISVIAAIKTNGFDAAQFPYWTLQPPHFDRRELFELAVRPPMDAPIATLLPNTAADATKINRLQDTAFQFATSRINTDGRPTKLSIYSLPIFVRSEDYNSNPDNLPKNINITFNAGSPLTERIYLYVRQCKRNDDGSVNTLEWGTWVQYDYIDKYSNCGANDPSIIGSNYWMRTGQWQNNNYDSVMNTIQYRFDNSKIGVIVSPEETILLQNDIPQVSVAMGDLGDALALAGNRINYNNFGCDVLNNIDASIQERANVSCDIPTRKIYLYAYIGRMGDGFQYISQVGFYNGADTQMRWGGLSSGETSAILNIAETKNFNLNFADRNSFVAYLKGTPYTAVGEWYQVNSPTDIVALPSLLDLSSSDQLVFVQGVYNSGAYFIAKFTFEVPAGRYIACLGRHNIPYNEDYRGQSTYVMGIANSKITTNFGTHTSIIPIKGVGNDALVTTSKEMELDCTSGDLDTWGNGRDLFYVFCPYITNQGNKKYRFIEGQLFENPNNLVAVEDFPYHLSENTDASGALTDKNGSYFAYTKANDSADADIYFSVKLNCVYPTTFHLQTSPGGAGYRPNPNIYLSDHNGSGACNVVLVTGKITNLDGTTPYSNISVSIVDGGTAITDQNGLFKLRVHNGQNTQRINNIYINANGAFGITIDQCGYLPLFGYNENIIPCVACDERSIQLFADYLGVNVISYTSTSLKENGTYEVGIAGADLAGRLMRVNVIDTLQVPSFLQRDDLAPTFIQMQIKAALKLTAQYPDIAYLIPYVSKNQAQLKFIQWVGDSIAFIDNNGKVTTDTGAAVFASITINSLYNYNTQNNFSTLSTYQFVSGDRLRVLDDGNGNTFNIDVYGSPIDVIIEGQTYNQAAINANLLPSTSTVPVVNNNITNTINTATESIAQTQQATSITLLVLYDSRFDKLANKTGFWLEIYTPTKVNDSIPYLETQGAYPIIDGEIATYTGEDNTGAPLYIFPTSIDLSFWDTYFLSRVINIATSGSKYYDHPFESPNISDRFGINITSGGRVNAKDDKIAQTWFGGNVIKSDAFLNNGILNGLGTFREENSKDFDAYPFGTIQAMFTQRSTILFVCENDFFYTGFNFHYAYPNAQGVMVTNLDGGLSTPQQKIGNNYGCSGEDTLTIKGYDKYVFWYDRKNMAFIICNYSSAKDISDILGEDGRRVGIKSYLIEKTKFITNWNKTHELEDIFDVSVGVDMDLNNVLLSFRPRRSNSINAASFVNQRRNLDIHYQETMIYNLDKKRWLPMQNYVPESYGNIRGNHFGSQMITFANGRPYTNNNKHTDFLNYFGQQTFISLFGVFNKEEGINKVWQNISFDSNELSLWSDIIYTNEKGSFSLLPLNLVQKKENLFYGSLLRNGNSYPPTNPAYSFSSMFFDGKRNFGTFMVVRFMGDMNKQNEYFELKGIYTLFTGSFPTKK